ncbi:hypothetical protein CFP56_023766 [Quercus suber]|uniref:Uncharacterized protein n=1 Tax=Quercus suber TaxID=58331 RepID=A0AAW0K8W0_QUESU
MKAQKYCFYLLSLLILPIYAASRGGKHGGLDAADDWQPITNINDESNPNYFLLAADEEVAVLHWS